MGKIATGGNLDLENEELEFISTRDFIRSDRKGTTKAGLNMHLAPDSYGNEIPPDATWTKIARQYVSVEVLEHLGVRYEARRGFVAILGVVSETELEEYIRRSADVRRRRNHDRGSPLERSRDIGESQGRRRGKDGRRRGGRDREHSLEGYSRSLDEDYITRRARKHVDSHQRQTRNRKGGRTAANSADDLRDFIGIAGSVASLWGFLKQVTKF